ncbi:MAG TPA: hypothetical protein DCZ95_17850 [Verrucomicrobia bacterium]|nr:MAG: hypothetical protein A2X46_07535 [Lentisphaerae bacterium GWF2_57_35]HBA85951.1 hypothetical protein [Verrucomicrobiota bacterium]
MNFTDRPDNKQGLRHIGRQTAWWCLSMNLALGFAFPAAAEVSEPVGFVRMTLASNSPVMVSMPFDPFDPSLAAVFSNQLQGAAEESNADRIVQWDAQAQNYVVSFKADDAGEFSGRWFESGTNETLSSQTLEAGGGFWIENRHQEQQVFLCGSLLLDSAHPLEFLHGLNAFGYPYPVAVPLAQTELAAAGALGGTHAGLSDLISCEVPGETNWLFQSGGHPLNNTWLNDTGAVSDLVVRQGMGYWYNRKATNSLSWSIARPYADLFSGGTNAPHILAMTASPNRDGLDLLVACSGAENETLEIFYKDIAVETCFSSEGAWRIADQGVAVSGRTTLVWQDGGGVGRPAVSSVFSRVYVVSRQDSDADGDSLSDGRETLVHGTDQTRFDTDGDGLSDGAEMVIGTDPVSPDTDQDGMGDGAELQWGFCPTSTASYASLSWNETFESLNLGSIHDQNGWLASPSEAATVQTGTVKTAQQAVELDSSSGSSSLQHYFGAAGATNIWVDMWVFPVRGALPEPAAVTGHLSAAFAVDIQGRLCGFDGSTADWLVATNGPAVGGQWTRLTFALDYEARKWSLYQDGDLRLQDLGFVDNSLREFSRAQWQNRSGSQSSFLDDVIISSTEPSFLDDDQDGMPNVWERLYGLNVAEDDAAADPDGDGLSNLGEFQQGTNPLLADTDSDGFLDGEELAWGLDPAVSNSVSALPWTCDFEAGEGYAAGALAGQDQWLVPFGAAIVQSNLAASGTQALRLQAGEAESPARIQYSALASTGTVVWTDLHIQMIPSPLPASPSNLLHATAVVRLDRSLALAAFDGATGLWIVDSNSPAGHFRSWLHLTVKRDYSTKTWSLYQDGRPIFKDLGFADPTVTHPSLLRIDGGSAAGEYVDALSLSASMPAHIDDDNDGLPNAQEDANANGLVDEGETNPFNPDTDADGMDDGRETDWGFSPGSSNNFTLLPWTCGFEAAEGYSDGLLNAQQGWLATTSVVVQASSAAEGEQAVELQLQQDQMVEMHRFFGAGDQKTVWVETYARLQPGILPVPSAIQGSHAVLFAVNEKGLPCAYDGLKQGWLTSTLDFLVQPSSWTRVVFGVDYVHQVWSLYIQNKRVFKDIAFANGDVRSLSRAQVAVPDNSPLTASAFIDEMTAQSTEPEGLDNDGDGMPNSWEREKGLDPENVKDKGWDSDEDGLSNYAEYLAGTDPLSSDTDSDGVSDYEEIYLALSDPLVADFSGEPQMVAALNGNQTSARSGEWYSEGGVLSGIEPNGYAEYNVSFPSNGVYVLEADVRQGNPMTQESDFDVFAFVDEYGLGRAPVVAPYGNTKTARFFLPFLDAGDHTIRILWRTRGVRSIFQISAVRLIYAFGPDQNENGIPDWMDHRAQRLFSWTPPAAASLVSPVCLEGESIYAENLQVYSSFVPDGVETQDIVVSRTIDNGWYANAPLSPTSSTEVAVYDSNGQSWFTNAVTWEALDLFAFSTNRIRIRLGDSLLFAAGLINTDGITDIHIQGLTNYPLQAGASIPHRFTNAGVFTVEAAYTNGASTNAQIQVEVVRADFEVDPICVIGCTRTWDCASIAPSTYLDIDSRLIVSKADRPGGGTRFSLRSATTDRQGIVARLNEAGPILDHAEVQTIYYDTTAYRNVAQVFRFEDGSDMIEVTLRFNQVPSDFCIRLHVFIGGVTFADGTLERMVTAQDFDEVGEYRYRLIRAPHQQSSVCHTTEFLQNDGSILKTEN